MAIPQAGNLVNVTELDKANEGLVSDLATAVRTIEQLTSLQSRYDLTERALTISRALGDLFRDEIDKLRAENSQLRDAQRGEHVPDDSSEI